MWAGEERNADRKRSARTVRRIVVLAVLVLSVFLISHPYRWFTNRAIDQRAREIAREFGVSEEPIDVGASRHCYDSPPVRSFDFGTDRGCVTYRAKLIFPRVEISQPYDPVDPDTASDPGRRAVLEEIERINRSRWKGIYFAGYLDAEGSTDTFFRRRTSTRDEVDVAFVTMVGTTKPPFDGRWQWQTARPKGREGGSYVRFVEKIERSVFEEDHAGRASVSEMLADGRAPFLLFYSDRYCHNVPLPVVDLLPCFLPG